MVSLVRKQPRPEVKVVSRVKLPKAEGNYFYYLFTPKGEKEYHVKDSDILHINPEGHVQPGLATLAYNPQRPPNFVNTWTDPSAVAGAFDEAVSAAGFAPIVGFAYAGQDIVRGAQSAYYKDPEASKGERVKKTAKVVADKTLYHMIGTILLPYIASDWFLAPPVSKLIKKIPEQSRWAKVKQHPRLTKASVLVLGSLLLSQPIDWVTRKILDYVYYPLFDKKKREQIKTQFRITG